MTGIDNTRAALTAAQSALDQAQAEYVAALKANEDLSAALQITKADRDALAQTVQSLNAKVSDLTAQLADCQDTTPDPPPDPQPEPTPTGMPPLIGMSAPANRWVTYKQQVEATGGKLEARRFFYGDLASDPSDRLRDCVREGLAPVVSFKTSPYTWAQMASGAGDTTVKAQAARIKAVMGDRLGYIAFHHEPDKQADPRNVGEGGSGADFAAMQAHLSDLVKPLLPAFKFGVIMNGWWWSAQARGFSDAEINVWLPKSTRDRLDWIGADDYNMTADASEKAVDRVKRRSAWMDRVGYKGFTGIGETNAFTGPDLQAVFDLAKKDAHFKGGFVAVWNSDTAGTDFVLKGETLTTFQGILKSWR